MKINSVLALFVLAALPACKKEKSCNACYDACHVEERVSGPAGWDLEEEAQNELK